MGEHRLHGLGVPLDELTQRELTSLDYFVEIFYRGHLQITSIVGNLPFLSLSKGGESSLPSSAHDASRVGAGVRANWTMHPTS